MTLTIQFFSYMSPLRFELESFDKYLKNLVAHPLDQLVIGHDIILDALPQQQTITLSIFYLKIRQKH